MYTLEFEKCCSRSASPLLAQSYLHCLPPDNFLSAHLPSPSSFNVAPSNSRSRAPNTDRTLKSPRELLKNPNADTSPLTKQESLGMEPRHYCCMIFLLEILMCIQVMNHWSRVTHLHLRLFTSFPALIFWENANIPSERQNCYLSFALCLGIGFFLIAA